MGDPRTTSKEAGVRVAWQGGEDRVPFSQLRHFMGWVFWYSPNWSQEPSKALMLQISKEIDDSDLWGRTPTVLGTFRRNGQTIKAKKTSEYPKLWSLLVELALRA